MSTPPALPARLNVISAKRRDASGNGRRARTAAARNSSSRMYVSKRLPTRMDPINSVLELALKIELRSHSFPVQNKTQRSVRTQTTFYSQEGLFRSQAKRRRLP